MDIFDEYEKNVPTQSYLVLEILFSEAILTLQYYVVNFT